MSYKDKSKANAAAKIRMQRYRNKGVTQGVTSPGVTTEGVTLTPLVMERINTVCANRKAAGLEDDYQERINRAMSYKLWNDERCKHLIKVPLNSSIPENI